MGFYSQRFFPWMVDRGLDHPELLEQRRDALREAAGRVLEIGFGPGASLAAYPLEPGRIREVIGLEPNPGMLRRARRRLRDSPLRARPVRGSCAALPFPDMQFDTVASNWTLCSLRDLPSCLREVRRVLRPGGRFLFLEHGRSPDPVIARRQALFAPLFRILGDGCRPDIAMDEAIRSAGFRIASLTLYDGRRGSRIARQMYRGVARAS